MEELRSIMEKFVASGWDVISVPAVQWLGGASDKAEIVAAVKHAEMMRENRISELAPLYKRVLELIQ